MLAVLCLGGNTGDVAQSFAEALQALTAGGAAVERRSSVWRTPPWGKTDQPDFRNIAVIVRTDLSPRALLDLCLAIEHQAGRVRLERWGPRTLDIDILTYGDAVTDEPGLTIPHPRMLERAFVLAPLAEIAPEMVVAGVKVSDALQAIDTTGLTIDAEATAIVET
ncbi:2-amino-4-hydroxy-6-hydroxymethyldihydropteridinediphosphokinase [Beijerinckia sp. 28-YEA-48]|nr:2-amino-4-hydroxy-6-hydroxymethyldihydropteridinediphosphokinase [Beijerinckia sp. 28-YEA-48]